MPFHKITICKMPTCKMLVPKMPLITINLNIATLTNRHFIMTLMLQILSMPTLCITQHENTQNQDT
jgi:hypothetical protein